MSERGGFLARWSRRKREVAAGRPPGEAPPARAVEPAADTIAPVASPEPAAPAPLPPVETLTAESDFAPFMAREVDPELKRSALKTLFRDERFNVMDGLDVYIDDYSKTTPIPAEWYERMTQLAGLGDVPAREAAEAQAEAERQALASADPLAENALPALPESAPPSAQPDDSKDPLDDSASGGR